MANGPEANARPQQVAAGTGNIVEAYRGLAESNPKDRYAVRSLLMAYLSSRSFLDGIQEFRKLEAMAPDSAQIHFCLGVLYEKYERMDDAIRHYLRTIELDPEEELVYRFLSTRYLVKGESENAYKVCKMGLERFPRSELLNFNMGYALARMRRYDESIACFEKEVQCNPQCSEAYTNLDLVKRNKVSALKLRQ